MGTGAAKITNENIPVRVHTNFFEKIACAETAEPRMTVSYTTLVHLRNRTGTSRTSEGLVLTAKYGILQVNLGNPSFLSKL